MDAPPPPPSGAIPDALLAKTAKGTAWVIVWRMATRVLGLANTLILVRLLLPEDFGLVALGTSFAQAIDAFSILGVEDAVIREKAPTRDVYDTAFTLSLVRGAVTCAIIAALAFPAASFFSEGRLASILFALAAAALIEGFANIGILDFRRDFAFDKEFRFLILPRVLAIVLSIAAAVVLRSYWALIVGIVSQRIFRVFFGYWMHPYRPTLTLRAWRGLVGYSLWTWAVSVVVLIRDRSDSILIGRILNPTQVGIYAIGAEVAALPTTELVEPLGRAAYSSFAAARHSDDVTEAELYSRIVATMALLTLPAGIGISLIGTPLVQLAFGSLWAGAGPLVQLLGIAGAATVFGTISADLFRAHAQLHIMFRITFAAIVLRVVLLIVLIPPMGLLGAATAAAIAIITEQVVYVALTVRHFGVTLTDLVRGVWRSVVATAVMAWVMVAMGFGWGQVGPDARLAGHLAAAVAIGMSVYAATLWITWAASGRPSGAESNIWLMVRRLTARLAAPLRVRLGFLD